MSAIKLLNTLALSTLAILLLSFAPSRSLAVSIQPNHLARQVPNHHGITKKKKRDNTRCKPKSSSPAPEPTSTPSPSQTDPPKVDVSLPTTGSPGNTVTNPQNTGSGPTKFAVAWGIGEDPRINLFKNHAVMIHLWSAWIPQVVKDSGIPFSIMLHDARPDTVKDFLAVVQQDYTGTTHVFGFNEYVNFVRFYSSAWIDPLFQGSTIQTRPTSMLARLSTIGKPTSNLSFQRVTPSQPHPSPVHPTAFNFSEMS